MGEKEGTAVKIGLVGYGYWGAGYVARNIARVADLAVIIDPDPARLVQAAEQWGPWGTRVASEPEVAFRNCDAVWIAAPAQTHYHLVKEALSFEKHVMCEKPFVLDAGEASYLAEMAEESGLALMVGHVALFQQYHNVIKSRFANGNLEGNKLIYVRHTTKPSLSDVNVLWGLGPHDVASALDAYGDSVKVVCSGNNHRAYLKLLKQDGQELANIFLDWLAAERLQLVKTSGYVSDRTIDHKEPLLSEAVYFVKLCREIDGPERERQRGLAVGVTNVLAIAQSQIKGEAHG